jgi:hypothetical protein
MRFAPPLLLLGAGLLAGCNQRPCDGGLDAKRGPTARLDVALATCNHRPEAQLPRSVRGTKRVAVTLDGSGSVDKDGDPLTFTWRMVPPEPSVLIQGEGAKVALLADQQGTYTVSLTVSDGGLESVPVQMTVEIDNTPPVAQAGADFIVPVGGMAQLDGSQSSDPDGDPLTYQWRIEVRPPGSAAVLGDAGSARPSFTADVPGVFVLALEVSDGAERSAADRVRVGSGITGGPPVADAGPDRTGLLGAVVTVDGSGSRDPDGDPITYQWRFLSWPPGSSPSFSSTSTVQASFRPDQLGTFEVELVVSDGFYDSADTTVVTVSPGFGAAGDLCDVAGCVEGALCFDGVCVGGGKLRFSLSWTVISDFDLHVQTPSGEEIYFANRSAAGGELDVDDCVGNSCLSTVHVENVVFVDTPDSGRYRVWVVNYNGGGAGDYRVEVYGAARATFTGVLPAASGQSSPVYEVEVP